MGDDLRLNFQDALKMGDSLFEKIVAFQVFEIADVLAEKSFRTSNDADCILQFASDGQDGLRFLFNGNRNGSRPWAYKTKAAPASWVTTGGSLCSSPSQTNPSVNWCSVL